MHAIADAARRRADCGSVAHLLPAVASGDARLEGRAEAHVASCLRCQAELARYRRLRRTMRTFGDPDVVPGPDLLPAILAGLDRAGSSWLASLDRRTWVEAGVGVAALGAAAVLGTLLWVGHRRSA